MSPRTYFLALVAGLLSSSALFVWASERHVANTLAKRPLPPAEVCPPTTDPKSVMTVEVALFGQEACMDCIQA